MAMVTDTRYQGTICDTGGNKEDLFAGDQILGGKNLAGIQSGSLYCGMLMISLGGETIEYSTSHQWS